MDDIPFFNTTPDETRGVPEGYPRGGIFDPASKVEAGKTVREEVTIEQGQGGPSQQPGISIDTSAIQNDASLGKHIKEKLSPTKRDPSPTKYKGGGISSKDKVVSSPTASKKRSPVRGSIPLPSFGYNKKKDDMENLTIHKNVTEPVLATEPMLSSDSDDVSTRGRQNQPGALPQGFKISPDSVQSLGEGSNAQSGLSETVPAPIRPQTIHGDASRSTAQSGSDTVRSSASPTRRAGGLLAGWTRPLSAASADSKDHDSVNSTRSASPSDTLHPSTEPSEAAAPTASVIDLFKARDRSGLEAKGAVAKTRFAKWGTESFARGKAEIQRLKGEQIKSANVNVHPSSIPVPTHGSPTTHTSGNGLSTSPNAVLGRSPGKSLQERLRDTARAAEAANAATLGHHPDGRVRSASNTSNTSNPATARPALLSSPSKGEPSVSEPDLVSATHHNRRGSTLSDKDRRPSTSTTPPVLSQPAGGRSMVVPRVSKRSGEVTGLGAGEISGQGHVTKQTDGVKNLPAESRDTETVNVGLPLSPREGTTKALEPLPHRAGPPSSRGLPTKNGSPPPLPVRDRPVSQTSPNSKSLVGISNMGTEADMERSKSHPGQSRSPPVKSKTLPSTSPKPNRGLSFSLSRSKKSGSQAGSTTDVPALERSMSLEDMIGDHQGQQTPEDAGVTTDAITMSKKEKKTSPSRAQHALRMFSDKTSPTKKEDLKLGSQVRAPE